MHEHDPFEDYLMQNGFLYKSDREEKNKSSQKACRLEIIPRAYEEGHFGPRKTIEAINCSYYIENLQNNYYIQGKAQEKLHPIPKGETPLDTMHLDHVRLLQSSIKRYVHMLVIMYSFTKFVWIFPVKSTSAKEVLQKLRLYRKIFGNSRKIITDQRKKLTSGDFQKYCET